MIAITTSSSIRVKPDRGGKPVAPEFVSESNKAPTLPLSVDSICKTPNTNRR